MSGWVARGPQVAAFERELCEYLHLEDGCAAVVSSGTAALYLAIRLLEPRAHDVAIPAYACAALANAAAMAQCSVTFMDTGADTPNPGAPELSAANSPLAVLANMYGIPARAGQSNVPYVDDAAQALGARADNEFVGTRGRAGVLSFYATKLITAAGAGGAVVSKDRAFIELVRDYLDFDCRRDDVRRFNFAMTDVQAAVGRAQLKKLDGFIARRAEIYEAYRAAGLPLLGSDFEGADRPVRYRAVLRTQHPRSAIDRLARAGVTAIVPTEDWELPQGDFPNARALCQSTVSLPIYPSLTDAEVSHICSAVTAAA